MILLIIGLPLYFFIFQPIHVIAASIAYPASLLGGKGASGTIIHGQHVIAGFAPFFIPAQFP